jgi:cystathionine beta-lyase
LFSVVLDARFNQDQTDAFCDALRLFKLGYSWGGPISLVVPYDLRGMRTAWPAHLSRGTVVRFSIGLEAVQALQDDIAQAMRVLR